LDFQGKVSGVDVIATPSLPIRCLAFVTAGGGTNEIQVTALEARLQSALELASAKDVEVEVTYDNSNPANELTRVRLLDH
jgi:hypothetical protein